MQLSRRVERFLQKGLYVCLGALLLVGLVCSARPIPAALALPKPLLVDNSPGCSDTAALVPYCTIQAAVNTAPAGATIPVNPGVGLYPEHVTIDRSLTLAGASAAAVVVDGQSAGRVFTITAGMAVTLSGITIQNGYVSPGDGGGVYNAGTLVLTDSTVYSNTCTGMGGGIFNDVGGVLTIQNSTIISNTASDEGGGVATVGDVSIASTIFLSNTAPDGHGGGGLSASGGVIVITGTTFANNSGYVGGGITTWTDSGFPSLDLNNCTFSANQATGEWGNGGGISSNGDLFVQASTFVSNTTTGASSDGGGLYHINGAAAITNTTFSGNSTTGSGGGIYFRDSTMTLNYVTIANNTADSDNFDPGWGSGDGGGIFVRDWAVALDTGNTIIAGNSDGSGGGADCFVEAGGISMNSLDYNLIQDTTGCIIGGATAHNITGASPVLGPLQNNGGGTHTHALLSGSPAIDAAHPADCPATDQRGVARPQGAQCDIGAYEAQMVMLSLAQSGTGRGVITSTMPSINCSADVCVETLAFGTVVTLTATPDITSTFAGWSGACAGTGACVVMMSGPAQITATFDARSVISYYVYLPLVFRSEIRLPDLIVEQLVAAGDAVTVIIKNIGNAPATDEFWVDVYVTPNPVPTAVNQRWDDGRSAQGIAWGVLASALPLQPGDTLTLTRDSIYYDPIRSYVAWPLPAGTTVYAQADSWNLATTYGAVLENHEMTGGAYNNITYTVSLVGGPAFSPTDNVRPFGELPASFGKLPPRQ